MKVQESTTPKGKNKVIYISDLQFHSREKVTPSVGKKIQQAFQTGNPGRLYFPLPKTPLSQKDAQTFEFSFELDPETLKMISEEEAKGNTVSFELPPGGAPVFLAGDTMQFVKSKNGQRLLRKLDNKNNENKM